MGEADATNVKDGTITSSACPTPAALSARYIADVPLLTAYPYWAPQYFAKFPSNSLTFGPFMYLWLSKTCITDFFISSVMPGTDNGTFMIYTL